VNILLSLLGKSRNKGQSVASTLAIPDMPESIAVGPYSGFIKQGANTVQQT
jgi:hypothetical protein